ncbi:MAG TPA: hypothetical protein VK585_03900, partial [Jiangellaceae bacterium]|nr:hypothetical protein [Jiangellaceae bacterium]
ASPAKPETVMDVTLQYFDDCPNWQTANERLRALADELDIRITYHRVSSVEEAEELAFRGSPTILIDGRDPFARGDEPSGLACRVYPTPDGPAGSPTTEQLRALLA